MSLKHLSGTCPGDTVLVLTKPWSHAVQVVNNRLLHEWRQDMAKTRKRYQKRSPDQWKQLIAEQRSSGQSVRGFARSRCICESSMWRWSKLLDLEGESDQDKTRHALSGAESRGGGLVELVTQHQRFDVEPRSDEVRMLVGSGVCLELSRLPAPEYLALVAHTYDAMSS